MRRRRVVWLAIACLGAAPRVSAQANRGPDDIVMRAMRDELKRSIEQLRLDTLPKPYFVAYRVEEASPSFNVRARLGSLLGGGDYFGHSRFLTVEVRVGDYAFDNTNYFGAGFMPAAFVGAGQVPIDDDYREIRRQLWLATDQSYKQALEALSQKRATLQTRMKPDSTADFSREAVETDTDVTPAAPADAAEAETLVRQLSAVFRGMNEIYNSSAGFSAGWSLTRYVNSEGTSFTHAKPRTTINVRASTQSSDGMPLADAYVVSATTPSGLPTRDSLMNAVRGMAARLKVLRETPIADAYEGPVLFEGMGAVELFNAVIAPKLVATRRPVTNPQMDRMFAGAGNDWTELLGSPVLPKWLSVVDDPTLRSIEGKPVEGYRVDDDGVRARATTVVDHGVLKTLLTTRVPAPGVARSTANRRGFGAAPSNVIVTADNGITPDSLRRRLLALATALGLEYAVVVRRLGDSRQTAMMDQPDVYVMGAMMSSRSDDAPSVPAAAAFKVYPDGREVPMRAAEIGGLGTASFRSIVAASSTRTVSSTSFAPAGYMMMMGNLGTGTVTYAMPSLLFANASVRRPRGANPTLPVVPPPPVER